ncbi:MAG: glycosyltransferase family 2 protein [Candidatus Oleimicrobiaceae bacterium]
MASGPSVSVVIPTCNQAHVLRRVLAALAAQVTPEVETVVVDDGSEDDTEQVLMSLLQEGKQNLTYVRQDNKGAAAARNVGLSRAKAEVVVFLDGDLIPAPGLVEAHVRFHREHPCLTHLALGRVEMAAELGHARQLRQHETTFPFTGGACVEVPWHFVRSGNFSAKREFLVLAGGFDPEMRSAAEDTELAFRLLQRGARVFFLPLAVAIHYHPMTETKCYLRKAASYGQSLAYWYRHAPQARSFIVAHYGLQAPETSIDATVRHVLHGAIFNRLTERLWLGAARCVADGWYRGAAWIRRQVYKARYRSVFTACLRDALHGRGADVVRPRQTVVRIVSNVSMRALCRARM